VKRLAHTDAEHEVLMRDITERTQAEEERRRLAEQAEQTAKLKNLGMLAGGIAHDFNNLLMIIQGHTDLCLRNVPLASDVGVWLREIENATGRAAALCGRLVALSGGRAQDLRPLDLSAVIRDTRRLLGASMSQTVNLTESLADDLPPLHGDLAQVQLIVMNLLINAVQAVEERPRGTIRITTGLCECDQHALRACRFAEGLTPGRYEFLEVEDNGCGMDPETTQRIFEPLFTTKPSGHGLGLAAVLNAVRSHRGGILVASEPGRGSRFRVLFRCPAAG